MCARADKDARARARARVRAPVRACARTGAPGHRLFPAKFSPIACIAPLGELCYNDSTLPTTLRNRSTLPTAVQNRFKGASMRTDVSASRTEPDVRLCVCALRACVAYFLCVRACVACARYVRALVCICCIAFVCTCLHVWVHLCVHCMNCVHACMCIFGMLARANACMQLRCLVFDPSDSCSCSKAPAIWLRSASVRACARAHARARARLRALPAWMCACVSQCMLVCGSYLRCVLACALAFVRALVRGLVRVRELAWLPAVALWCGAVQCHIVPSSSAILCGRSSALYTRLAGLPPWPWRCAVQCGAVPRGTVLCVRACLFWRAF